MPLKIPDTGTFARVKLDRDAIAFQVGEALQVASGGALRATPHCVVAPSTAEAQRLTRCTFALFMQPKWDEAMACPGGVDAGEVGVEGWTWRCGRGRVGVEV